tara:strand:+ start:8509 stop:9426 length:918 start_codon:yes stop_codon:yes gene_type:complete
MKIKNRTIIFGAGYHARNAFRKCKKKNSHHKIIYFVDNDKKKNNKFLFNTKIISPNNISNLYFDKIIFCGRHIKDQIKQIKKIGINKSKFIFWGQKELGLKKKDLKKRSKILNYMLSYIANEFTKNNINYWIDFSGLLALVRKQDLAEMSDVDVSIYIKDLKKILIILKKKNKYFKFYSKPFLKPKFDKHKVLKYHFCIIGTVNNEKIEAPGIGFHVNRIKKKYLEKNTIVRKYPYKLLRDTKKYTYKGINLTIPKKSKEYLNLVYGKSWKKKEEFYSSKHLDRVNAAPEYNSKKKLIKSVLKYI